MARALSPAILRLGGTDADFVIFNDTVTTTSKQVSVPDNGILTTASYENKYDKSGYGENFTMTGKCIQELLFSSSKTGFNLL